MKNWNRLAVTGLLTTSFVMAGCGSPPISKELRTARDAYESASEGVAGELAPAELDSARQALEEAESAFKKDHESQETVDLSYIAKRKAQMAEVAGLIEQEKRHRKIMRKKLKELEKSRADMTREELEVARAALAEKKRLLAEQTDQLTKTSAQLEQERKLRANTEKKLSAALTSLDEIGKIKEEKRGVVITLSGSVLFATGKYMLLPIAKEKLNDVAKALKDQGYKHIVVEGHTDSRGSETTNKSLSLKRANSVREHLVSQGIEAKKISAVGLGEQRPVADNDSPEGRANNRRVELVVTPE